MRFLFVDRILHSIPGESIRGIKHVTADDHYLNRDSDGRYYFISSLIGETLGQLAAWNVMERLNFTKRPVAGVVSSVTMHRHVYVGETLCLDAWIDSLDESAVRYHAMARVGDEVVFEVHDALGPLLSMADFIDDETIRRQFAEINRPGDDVYLPELSFEYEIPRLEAQMIGCRASMTFDRLLRNKSDDAEMVATKCISRSSAYFPDHFPRKPVLPMTVLLECKLNLAKVFLRREGLIDRYRIHEMRRVKMNEFVLPGDVVTCFLTVKRQDAETLVLQFRSEVDGKRVCVMELAFQSI